MIIKGKISGVAERARFAPVSPGKRYAQVIRGEHDYQYKGDRLTGGYILNFKLLDTGEIARWARFPIMKYTETTDPSKIDIVEERANPKTGVLEKVGYSQILHPDTANLLAYWLGQISTPAQICTVSEVVTYLSQGNDLPEGEHLLNTVVELDVWLSKTKRVFTANETGTQTGYVFNPETGEREQAYGTWSDVVMENDDDKPRKYTILEQGSLKENEQFIQD